MIFDSAVTDWLKDRAVGSSSSEFATSLSKSTRQCERRLWLAGVNEGDRVALTVPNAVEGLAWLAALSRAQADVLLVDGRVTEWERERMLRTFRPSAVVHGDSLMHRYQRRPRRDGEAFIVLATSGSTGEPRLIAKRWTTVERNGLSFAKSVSVTAEDRLLSCVPVSHSYGLLVAVGAITTGAELQIVEPPVTPARVWREIDGGASVVYTVPTVARWVAASASRAGDRRPRCTVVAGETLQPSVAELASSVDLPLTPHYGTTEAGAISTGQANEARSVGVPMPGVEVRIDPNTGILEAAPGGPSPWCIGNPAASKATFSRGWVTTGDIARLGPDDQIFLLGRAALMANIGGQRVGIEEIESAVSIGPGVEGVAATVRSDERGSDVVHVFVEGTDVDIGQLRRHTAKILSAYKVPRFFHVVPEIPRSPLGKPLRDQLPS